MEAAKPPLPVENDAVRDPSHSDPLQGYKRRQRYKYDADFVTPTSSEPVSTRALSYSQKAEWTSGTICSSLSAINRVAPTPRSPAQE